MKEEIPKDERRETSILLELGQKRAKVDRPFAVPVLPKHCRGRGNEGSVFR
jgi:hypothetical protein